MCVYDDVFECVLMGLLDLLRMVGVFGLYWWCVCGKCNDGVCEIGVLVVLWIRIVEILLDIVVSVCWSDLRYGYFGE